MLKWKLFKKLPFVLLVLSNSCGESRSRPNQPSKLVDQMVELSILQNQDLDYDDVKLSIFADAEKITKVKVAKGEALKTSLAPGVYRFQLDYLKATLCLFQ